MTGLPVPLLLILPLEVKRPPVVLAIAQGGKERFLSDRAQSLEQLIRRGVAVSGGSATGETSPDPDRSDHGTQQSIALREISLGSNLVGSRLKDLWTVLVYLRSRGDLDPRRTALWGEAFAPASPGDLYVDEIQWEGVPRSRLGPSP